MAINYTQEFIITFTNGQLLTAHLQKIERRYFWVNEFFEFAISIDDPEIAQATPIQG